jgi:hypothetical protein
MEKWQKEQFSVRPLGETRTWLTESSRYPEYSRMLLDELIKLTAEIKAEWPLGAGSLHSGDVGHAELWKKVRRRDLLSDSVRIFTAMAVESFLNFYGVVRLGQTPFDLYIERLSQPKKLQALLEICDGISANRCLAITAIVSKIAQRRNDLVHPKAREVVCEITQADKDADSTPIPGAALEAVQDMVTFYQQWTSLVPDSKFLLPDTEQLNVD